MSVVGDKLADMSSFGRCEGAPVMGVNPVWPSTMQSRPRLANVIGVVVGPAPPPPQDGTDSDSELGLPAAPSPPQTPRLERRSSARGRSTLTDAGPAAEENCLGDIDWTGVATSVVVIWFMWLRAGLPPPPPPVMIWRHRDAWESSTNSSWWRWRWRFEISFSSCSFSSSRLSVSYSNMTHVPDAVQRSVELVCLDDHIKKYSWNLQYNNVVQIFVTANVCSSAFVINSNYNPQKRVSSNEIN